MAEKDLQNEVQKKRPFKLVQRCQILSTQIVSATANAPKEYRLSICKEVQNLSYELIHTIRLANSFPFGEDRQSTQKTAQENIERINDLIPVAKRCRCITPEQEEEIIKTINLIRSNFINWVESSDEDDSI